ncbi:MAG: tetratricopeptide repeat protein, partial [Wenzhouxiangella sp.]
LSAALIGTTILVTGLAIGMSWLALQLSHERDQALAARATTDHVAGFIVDLFAAADPRQHLGDPPDARELLDRGAEQIEDLHGPPELTATLLQRMAEAYRHIGASDRADALFSQALALAGLPRGLRVELQLEQADLWRATGRLGDASLRLVQLIEELEATPTTPKALASAYNNYGLVLEALERPEQAENWIRRALGVALPESRASRVSRLAFGNNLALVLARQGRHDEAIVLLNQVIEDKIAVFGPRHPSVLLSRQNQADSYRRLGRLEETVALLEQIRTDNVVVHGEQSLAVAETDNELANAWHDMGAFDLAEAAYRRAYAFFDQYPRADPSIHAFVANNLASLLEDRGELIEAERWFDRSVQLRAALFAPDSLPYLRGLMNRVRVQIRLGLLDPADRDLTSIEQSLNIHHPDQTSRLFQATLLRAEWLGASGEAEQARALLASVDPQIVTSQLRNDRIARRWQALQADSTAQPLGKP